MGMNVGSRSSQDEPDVMIEMNMTPLIDVMLVLIIMLIITIPIQNHAVNLNMPNGICVKLRLFRISRNSICVRINW